MLIKSKILHIDYKQIPQQEFKQKIECCKKVLLDLLIEKYIKETNPKTG